MAAVYLDGGLEAARALILRAWGERIAAVRAVGRDPKTALQEWAQARGLAPPAYLDLDRQGPDHAPVFSVEARLEDGRAAEGRAASKRAAQQAAAEALLALVEGRRAQAGQGTKSAAIVSTNPSIRISASAPPAPPVLSSDEGVSARLRHPHLPGRVEAVVADERERSGCRTGPPRASIAPSAEQVDSPREVGDRGRRCSAVAGLRGVDEDEAVDAAPPLISSGPRPPGVEAAAARRVAARPRRTGGRRRHGRAIRVRAAGAEEVVAPAGAVDRLGRRCRRRRSGSARRSAFADAVEPERSSPRRRRRCGSLRRRRRSAVIAVQRRRSCRC